MYGPSPKKKSRRDDLNVIKLRRRVYNQEQEQVIVKIARSFFALKSEKRLDKRLKKMWRSPLEKRGGFVIEIVREFSKRNADIFYSRDVSVASTLCQKPR